MYDIHTYYTGILYYCLLLNTTAAAVRYYSCCTSLFSNTLFNFSYVGWRFYIALALERYFRCHVVLMESFSIIKVKMGGGFSSEGASLQTLRIFSTPDCWGRSKQ